MSAAVSKQGACFYGVGVGPGDPELVTLKAMRIIRQAGVISYIVNAQGMSQAKNIVMQALGALRHTQLELPISMPMGDDRRSANAVYAQAAQAIQVQLALGKEVVFLCVGDPLFFGSFAFLLARLKTRCPCVVVPGISSPQAAAASLQLPLANLHDSFAVLTGQHSDATIRQTLHTYDSVVIMKAGRARQRLLDNLAASGRLHEAHYVEYLGRENQRIVHDVSELYSATSAMAGPYFSLFVVLRQARECL